MPRKVLIVDDEPNIVDLAAVPDDEGRLRHRRRARRRRGMTAVDARLRPDLVLLDVMMPRRDRLRGLPAVARVRGWTDLKIVTADGQGARGRGDQGTCIGRGRLRNQTVFDLELVRHGRPTPDRAAAGCALDGRTVAGCSRRRSRPMLSSRLSRSRFCCGAASPHGSAGCRDRHSRRPDPDPADRHSPGCRCRTRRGGGALRGSLHHDGAAAEPPSRLLLEANPEHRLDRSGTRRTHGVGHRGGRPGRAAQDRRPGESTRRFAPRRPGLAQERNRLAALMAGARRGGRRCCNVDGQILLYNARRAVGAGRRARPVGLGRSVFGIIDRDRTARARPGPHRARFRHLLARGHHRARRATVAGAVALAVDTERRRSPASCCCWRT